jgi:hypothetical protein
VCRVIVVLTLIFASIQTGTAAPSYSPAQAAALALIDFPWEQLQYEIVFLPPRKGFRAMTIGKAHRIEVYARPADDARLLAYDIAHELGHAIDLTMNTPEARENWKQSRGIDAATPWFGCNRCSDYNTPAGDFAETFALMLLGLMLLGPQYFSGRIAPPPSDGQLQSLRSFFIKDSSLTQAN